MPSDLELTRDIAAKGEKARRAMAMLFERHFRVLCRRFRYLFPAVSEDEVIDSVSACMLRAFEQAASFRGEASFQSWVGGMVRNAIIDHLRRTKRDVNIAHDDLDDEAPPTVELAGLIDEKTPLTEYETVCLRECVTINFSRFCEQYPEAAAAIHEHFVEHTDLRELATLLGRSYGATRQFVSKEAAKLRRFLQPCLAHLRA